MNENVTSSLIVYNSEITAAIIGAIIGGVLAYLVSYTLYIKQQKNELKNIAKAIDINFDTSFYKSLSQITKLYEPENSLTSKNPTYPHNPLYSSNDNYFVFNYDISKFDYDLSAKLYHFYSDLFLAENNRLFIENNHQNPRPDVQAMCKFKLDEMIAILKKCDKEISKIRPMLKKIYEPNM